MTKPCSIYGIFHKHDVVLTPAHLAKELEGELMTMESAIINEKLISEGVLKELKRMEKKIIKTGYVPDSPEKQREEWSFDTKAEVVENKLGGKQSKLGVRLDLLDAEAVLRLGRVLALGAESHGVDNWRNIPRQDHINHALNHLIVYLAEKRSKKTVLVPGAAIEYTSEHPPIVHSTPSEDHLGHAMCRVMFAMATGHTTEK